MYAFCDAKVFVSVGETLNAMHVKPLDRMSLLELIFKMVLVGDVSRAYYAKLNWAVERYTPFEYQHSACYYVDRDWVVSYNDHLNIVEHNAKHEDDAYLNI